MSITAIVSLMGLLFGTGVLVTVGRFFYGKIKGIEQKYDAICLGVQALLRDRLIHDYNKYMSLGYAPIYAKENFENMWKQYHNLGVNGVMDETHESFKRLPTQPNTKGEYENENQNGYHHQNHCVSDCPCKSNTYVNG